MISISNDFLKVGVKTKGAELASIVSVKTGIEYLWQAKQPFWQRHSCILFPMVGAANQGHVMIEGERYSMPKHGFVRDREFKFEQTAFNSLSFFRESDSGTYTFFPFDFNLEARYTLDGPTLHVDYIVENKSNRIMPFCMGAHPAFNCPIESSDARSDYSLLLDSVETLESPIINEDGLISNRAKRVLDDADTLPITDDLFDEDALILSDFESESISFIDGHGKKRITVYFPGFPQLGIWSQNQHSPFVCIEPWYGMADKVGYKGEMAEKPGAISLASGEIFDCRHSIEILE